MNQYKTVSNGRRFLVYFVDFIIIGFIVYFLDVLMETIFVHTITNYVKSDIAYKNMQNGLIQYISDYISQTQFEEIMVNNAPSYLIYLITNFVVSLITFIVYLIIIPMFTKNHFTVARFLLKVKVISKNGSDLTKGTIILRESMSFLFYELFIFMTLVSGIMVLASGESLVDKISNTRMVYDEKVDEDSYYGDYYKNDNNKPDDYIDAEVNEIDK